MKKIKIITDYPNATHSPDFKSPLGARQDNHSNPEYLKDLDRVVGNKPFTYMDLGCAGGQSVVDVYNKGYVACGVEGSDLNVMLNGSIHGVSNNWKNYKDICLFKGDITKPFKIVDENDEPQLFDIITAWDVLEHPKPDDIPNVIDNIIKHLNKDGFFICLINTVHGLHHQCVQSKEWWLNTFESKGMTDVGFDFNTSPRHTKSPICENDYGFMFKLK